LNLSRWNQAVGCQLALPGKSLLGKPHARPSPLCLRSCPADIGTGQCHKGLARTHTSTSIHCDRPDAGANRRRDLGVGVLIDADLAEYLDRLACATCFGTSCRDSQIAKHPRVNPNKVRRQFGLACCLAVFVVIVFTLCLAISATRTEGHG
jgi:hypothetical protein